MQTQPDLEKVTHQRPADIPEPRDSADSRTRSYLPVYLLTLFLLLLFTGYAQYLNHQKYQTDIPVYDSMSYYDRIHQVMSVRQQEGFLAAIENACFETSTVCLPYLLSIPFSYAVEPCREVGVWIQVLYFGVFLFSLLSLLRIVLRADRTTALMGTLPFFLLSALYRDRAGITDMRVDLPMAFLYASAACWLLIGCQRRHWRDFLFAGLCMTAACLSRAIAPVYLIGGLLPVLLVELYRTGNRRQLLLQLLMTGGLVIACSGWFYVYHFKYLYYYYFIWNTDANANLPLLRAAKHIFMAAKSIGPFFAVYLLMIYFVSKTRLPSENSSARQSFVSHVPMGRLMFWFAWVGAAPLLILIAKRADLNPVVSLPAAFGLAILGLLAQWPRICMNTQVRLPRMAISLSTCLVLAMAVGYRGHTISKFPDSVAGQKQILKSIVDDAKSNRLESVAYSVAATNFTFNDSIKSTLQFENQAKYVSKHVLKWKEIKFENKDFFFLPSLADWDLVPGESMDEKIRLLVEESVRQSDYLIVPTPESVSSIKAKYGNSKMVNNADKILVEIDTCGAFTPISKPIRFAPGLELQVLRNSGPERVANRRQTGLNSLLR